MAPHARRWPQTGRAASPRRPRLPVHPRRRPGKARTWRCGCCAARLAARISCPSRRWSRSIWTRRGWTIPQSSSRRYNKTCLVSRFLSSFLFPVVSLSLSSSSSTNHRNFNFNFYPIVCILALHSLVALCFYSLFWASCVTSLSTIPMGCSVVSQTFSLSLIPSVGPYVHYPPII